ncbi:LacI family DNA-binding transcriptional regulator [Weissella coleopterorum]|uniref:LacI family DNA-binding transcriptional regulator n=1 Tax=Weissella coleopterorum TaxID=2714949 RepID=A0A6G8AZA5_9LACO|nr:LacI family DNA-binding transcriptional regulator [Weissella coleopterorum]QIL50299.1 LacI family DNA-binding transcriptional regulator [Weissella coleopterorum]
MNKKITINEIAKIANVSKTTVSRFLNQKFENMSQATKEKIERTIQEYDYQPNRQAQTLKTQSSLTIGISVADLSNLYTSRLLKGISQTFQDTNYQLLIMDADNHQEREINNIQVLLNENVDGIILQPLSHIPSQYQLLVDQGLPVIQVDRYVEPFTFPAIVSDNFQKSLEIADLVQAKQYEQILVLANQISGISSRMNRFDGLSNALTESNISVSLIEIDLDSDWHTKVMQFIEQPQKTAIFALNGQVLWEVVRFLQKNQIIYPKDVGLIGYDDDNFADLIQPGISVIKQNPHQIGQTAAKYLLDQLQNKTPMKPQNIRIAAELELRHSL